MFRLLGVLATFATLVYLTPNARAQSSSDFEASLAVTKIRTMGERLNNNQHTRTPCAIAAEE